MSVVSELGERGIHAGHIEAAVSTQPGAGKYGLGTLVMPRSLSTALHITHTNIEASLTTAAVIIHTLLSAWTSMFTASTEDLPYSNR